MKSSLVIAGILSVLSFLYTASKPAENDIDKERLIIEKLFEGINHWHFSPVPLNDEFSNRAFDLYIDRLDSRRRFLTQPEVNQLEKYRYLIDDQAKTGTFELFNHAQQLLENGIKRGEQYYKEILAQPFDFEVDEYVEYDHEKVEFAKTEEELKSVWRKYLKYRVMTSMLEEMESDEKKEDIDVKTSAEYESEARDQVEEEFDDWMDRLDRLKRVERLSDYLNALTNVFDPHTGYFEPREKERFDINMSGTLEGIGARLDNEGEHTKVVSVVVGGPAWKQKQLEVDDLILKVAQDEDEAKDITGWDVRDVVQIIRGKKGSIVKLTVKKLDGSVQEIAITRDVVILEEGHAKALTIDLPGVADHIGYITLPRFYADFNNNGGSTSSEDVKKLIHSLKDQHVNGIILDLRNNPGGSLRDVVKMSGYFIEDGPIVQVKSRNRNPQIYRDKDDKSHYDGPLIIMVNSYSASASEIIAAAMQDYERAVIVGSKSTYGKGTVQRFLDLDRAAADSNLKPLGEVKLTIQKYYRINGGSTQLKGVQPDIILPDAWHHIKTGERDYDHALEWSEIEGVLPASKKFDLYDYERLKKQSQQRIENNPVFASILDNAERMKERKDFTNYPLNFEQYSELNDEWKAEADMYEDLFVENEKIILKNLPTDVSFIQEDSSRIARNDEWLKTLRQDVYLEESLSIMGDIINSNLSVSPDLKSKDIIKE